jgi:hypothetical protein
MRPTFIVTSAIDSEVGIFPPEIRITQTHDTVNSIKAAFPDAILILAEGGNGKSIINPTPQFDQLRSRFNVFLDMTENDNLKHIHENIMSKITNITEMGGMSGLSKTIAEITLLHNVFDAIKNHDQLKPVLENSDRIFKVSGRYKLSPLFNPAVYSEPSLAGKYVFRKADPSWIPNAAEKIGIEHFYASRFWSFDTALLDDTMQSMSAMMQDGIDIAERGYIDVEHLLYKHIDRNKVVEFDHVHFMGAIAPNGMVIYD